MLHPQKTARRVFNIQGQSKLRYSRRTELTGLIVFVGLALAVGVSGSGITASNVHHWYLSLTPPPFTPPNWLFAPVWTALYIMMGLAAWLVWRQPDPQGLNQSALMVWGSQLALNAIWTPMFFGLHLVLPALLILLALFAAIALTIMYFLPLNRGAALLLAPYLAWVGFAAYLNGGFWWLNH